MISELGGRINTAALKAFYSGRVYPALVCLLVAAGGIFGIEPYTAAAHTVLLVGALVLSDTVKPVLISLLTFVMQVSVVHSPFYPSYSDYLYTGWRLVLTVAMACLIAAGILYFFIKKKIYARLSFKTSPLLLPLCLLSVAFLLNGCFSGKWQSGDLWFALANVAVYFFLFVFVYYGFSERESSEELAEYFAYISALVALVICAELIALFITSDGIFVDGAIDKTAVALGWGIWNLVGVSLTVLIPVIFYGAYSSKHFIPYFAAATLAYAAAVFSMSRNALLLSSVAYFSCLLVLCFKGERKRIFRYVLFAELILAALFVAVLHSQLAALLADYLERGLSDNGRFALWKEAFHNFLSAPVFGNGFYGFDVDDGMLFSFGPLAKQAHNTVLQLLSATGVVGLFAYAYYRYSTLKPIFKKPNLKKSFLAMSAALLLVGSLIDNFVFNIYPMFHYTVSLAIIFKAHGEENGA